MSTKTTNLNLYTLDHFMLQDGTIPPGVTALGSKYPMNESDVIIGSPNYAGGGTQTPIPLASLSRDFSLTINSGSPSFYDWSQKIKSGDTVQVVRGSIRHAYTVQNSSYDIVSGQTTISLNNNRDVVHFLDPFISIQGYTAPSYDGGSTLVDTFLVPGRKIESPNDENSLVKDFSVKIVPSKDPDTFSVVAEWSLDHSVKNTRLRWRSYPRNYSYSNLSFAVVQGGGYYGVPSAAVVSSTGRRAEIQPTVSFSGLQSLTGGTGYSSAPTLTAVGGGGTGASFSVSLTGSSVGSITIVSGGTGYTSTPKLVFTGGGGTGAAVTPVFTISNVITVQQGGGYLEAPTVSIDETLHTGATHGSITSSLSLKNEGRVDYIRVTDGGTGYTGASVSITGSPYAEDAIAHVEISKGSIANIVLDYPGYGYASSCPPVVNIVAAGSGTGASAIANVDIFSRWVYEDSAGYDVFTKTIHGFKYNIPYEIEILASQDEFFRGLIKYTNNLSFQYTR